jgi:hypothetical protein
VATTVGHTRMRLSPVVIEENERWRMRADARLVPLAGNDRNASSDGRTIARMLDGSVRARSLLKASVPSASLSNTNTT